MEAIENDLSYLADCGGLAGCIFSAQRSAVIAELEAEDRVRQASTLLPFMQSLRHKDKATEVLRVTDAISLTEPQQDWAERVMTNVSARKHFEVLGAVSVANDYPRPFDTLSHATFYLKSLHSELLHGYTFEADGRTIKSSSYVYESDLITAKMEPRISTFDKVYAETLRKSKNARAYRDYLTLHMERAHSVIAPVYPELKRGLDTGIEYTGHAGMEAPTPTPVLIGLYATSCPVDMRGVFTDNNVRRSSSCFRESCYDGEGDVPEEDLKACAGSYEYENELLIEAERIQEEEDENKRKSDKLGISKSWKGSIEEWKTARTKLEGDVKANRGKWMTALGEENKQAMLLARIMNPPCAKVRGVSLSGRLARNTDSRFYSALRKTFNDRLKSCAWATDMVDIDDYVMHTMLVFLQRRRKGPLPFSLSDDAKVGKWLNKVASRIASLTVRRGRFPWESQNMGANPVENATYEDGSIMRVGDTTDPRGNVIHNLKGEIKKGRKTFTTYLEEPIKDDWVSGVMSELTEMNLPTQVDPSHSSLGEMAELSSLYKVKKPHGKVDHGLSTEEMEVLYSALHADPKGDAQHTFWCKPLITSSPQSVHAVECTRVGWHDRNNGYQSSSWCSCSDLPQYNYWPDAEAWGARIVRTVHEYTSLACVNHNDPPNPFFDQENEELIRPGHPRSRNPQGNGYVQCSGDCVPDNIAWDHSLSRWFGGEAKVIRTARNPLASSVANLLRRSVWDQVIFDTAQGVERTSPTSAYLEAQRLQRSLPRLRTKVLPLQVQGRELVATHLPFPYPTHLTDWALAEKRTVAELAERIALSGGGKRTCLRLPKFEALVVEPPVDVDRNGLLVHGTRVVTFYD